MRLLGFAESERAIFRPVPFRKPDILRLLVLFQVNRPDYVNDALPVGRELRLVDLAHRSEVLRFQETFFRSEGGRQRKCESEKSDDARHGDGAFT